MIRYNYQEESFWESDWINDWGGNCGRERPNNKNQSNFTVNVNQILSKIASDAAFCSVVKFGWIELSVGGTYLNEVLLENEIKNRRIFWITPIF